MKGVMARLLRLLSQPEAKIAITVAIALATALVDPSAKAKDVPID